MNSLSGNHVWLETVILENPHFRHDWQHHRAQPVTVREMIGVAVPPGHRAGGVPQETYLGYRQGLESACADVVIATILKSGRPAVLGLRRSNPPYNGKWYMPGGAIYAYMPYAEFLREKIRKETGLNMNPEVLLGVYRNNAEDLICSVMALCYAALVPVETIRTTKPADGHDVWGLFTTDDLDALLVNETHWYPMHVWRKVLAALPLD